MKTDWMAEAACAGSELDFYEYSQHAAFGETGEALDWDKFGALVAICNGCPVMAECARFAMRDESPETFGVWAGTTPDQRRDLRRAHDPIAAVVDKARQNLADFGKRGAQMSLEGVA